MSKSPIKKTIPRRRLKTDSRPVDIGNIFNNEKLFDDPEANAEALRLVYVIYENFIFSWYQRVSNDTQNSLLLALTADSSSLVRELLIRARSADSQTFCQAVELLTDHFQLMNLAGLCDSPKWAERYLCTSNVEDDRIAVLSKSLLQSLCSQYSESTLTHAFLNDAIYTMLYKTVDTLSEPLVLYELLNNHLQKKPTSKQRLSFSECWLFCKKVWTMHKPFPLGLLPFNFLSQLIGLPIRQPFLYGMLLQLYRLLLQIKMMDHVFATISQHAISIVHTIDWKEAFSSFRHSFFPNGRFYLPPREVPDSPEEYKLHTVSNVEKLLKTNIFIDYVVEGRVTAERIVESVSDKRVNRVILLSLVELLVVTLFPEMATK